MVTLLLAHAVYNYIADVEHNLADKWQHGVIAHVGTFHCPCGIKDFNELTLFRD